MVFKDPSNLNHSEILWFQNIPSFCPLTCNDKSLVSTTAVQGTFPKTSNLTKYLPERKDIVHFVSLFGNTLCQRAIPNYTKPAVFETTRCRNLHCIFGTNLMHWKPRHFGHFTSFTVTHQIRCVAPGELAVVVTILALECFSNLGFSTIRK